MIPAEYCARIATETVPTVKDPTDETFRLSDSYGLGVWCTPGEETYKMAGLYGQLWLMTDQAYPDGVAVTPDESGRDELSWFQCGHGPRAADPYAGRP